MTTVTLIAAIVAIQVLVTLLLAKGFFSLHNHEATESTESITEGNASSNA